MSNIEQNLARILSSRYGRDVRQSIHDGIQTCYTESKFVPRGAYSSTATYSFPDMVTHGGGSYLYINPTPAAGIPLTSTSHWQQIAEKGDKGNTGDSGVYVGPNEPENPEKDIWVNPEDGADLIDLDWQALQSAVIDSQLAKTGSEAARDTAIAQAALAQGYAAQLAAGTASPAGTYANLAALNDGTPAAPNTAKIYLTLDDGNWCYHNGSAWVAGGVYQAASVTADIAKINNQILELAPLKMNAVEYRYTASTGYQNVPITFVAGVYYATNNSGLVAHFRDATDQVVADVWVQANASNQELIITNELAQQITYIRLYQNTITIKPKDDIVSQVAVNTAAIATKAEAASVIKKLDKPAKYVAQTETIVDGYINTNGVVNTSYSGRHYIVNVTPGDEYRLKNAYHADTSYPAYIIFGANNVNLGVYSGTTGLVETCDVVVPTLAVTIAVNMVEYTDAEVYKSELYTLDEKIDTVVSGLNLDFNFENSLNALSRIDKRHPFEFGVFDKAYFTFMNDDGRSDMYLYKDLCDAYSIPYSNAVPWENADVSTIIDGLPYPLYLKKIVDDGGEIFCHQLDPLTSASTDADILTLFRDGKKKLENAIGVKIRGIIQSGGSGYSTFDYSKGQKYCLYYFDYSDGYGTTPQYALSRQNPRLSLYADEDAQYLAFKSLIDDAVSNHKWVRFYCHGTTEMSIALLTRVFDYVASLGSSASWTTFGHMVDTFGA